MREKRKRKSEIGRKLLKPNDKCPSYKMRWKDPITGSIRQQTLNTSDKTEAEIQAREIEKSISKGTHGKDDTDWMEFVEVFVSSKDMPSTQETYRYDLLKVGSLINATSVGHVASSIDKIKAVLQRQKTQKGKRLSKETVSKHMRTLKAAMHWAKRKKFINEVPDFDPIPACTQAKARPVTTEEYERILDACEYFSDGASWRFFLKACWLSGLRISEALNLSWDSDPVKLVLVKGYYQIRFNKEGQKNRKDQQIPTLPEFTHLLKSIPENERQGYVFPKVRCGGSKNRYKAVLEKMKRISKRANVVTAEDHYATFHDLRRGFGTTMAYRKRASPLMLKKLMRHKCLSTTMQYYAQADAELLQDMLLEELGDSQGDLPNSKADKNSREDGKPLFLRVPEAGLEPARP
ncbi:site-specific integrase [Mariniblastus sp.]|nr:site-specific integrase [Mariniblastus sp.]MDB4756351.1 site-specific integrase [Mariniblastus sp.]